MTTKLIESFLKFEEFRSSKTQETNPFNDATQIDEVLRLKGGQAVTSARSGRSVLTRNNDSLKRKPSTLQRKSTPTTSTPAAAPKPSSNASQESEPALGGTATAKSTPMARMSAGEDQYGDGALKKSTPMARMSAGEDQYGDGPRNSTGGPARYKASPSPSLGTTGKGKPGEGEYEKPKMTASPRHPDMPVTKTPSEIGNTGIEGKNYRAEALRKAKIQRIELLKRAMDKREPTL